MRKNTNRTTMTIKELIATGASILIVGIMLLSSASPVFAQGCTSPTGYFVPSTDTYCPNESGGTIVVQGGSISGYTFRVYNNSGTLLTTKTANSGFLQFDPAFSPGTYSVRVVNSCNQEVTLGSCTISQVPAPTASVNRSKPPHTTFCDANPGTLTFTAGSGSGYQWYIDGSAYSTGSTLTYPFDHSVYGTPGSHTVKVSYNVSYACSTSYTVTSSNEPVTIIANPVISASNTTICTGQTAAVIVNSNPQNSAIQLNWTVSQTNVTGAAGGNGAATPFTISQQLTNTTANTPGTVTYHITSSIGNCAGNSIAPVVTVETLAPPPGAVADDAQVCANQTTNVMVRGATPGRQYRIYRGTSALTTKTCDASGTIAFGPYGVGTYNIYYVNQTCNTEYFIDSSNITTTGPTPPAGSVVVTDANVCPNQTAEVVVQGAIAGDQYRIYNGTTALATKTRDANGVIKFGPYGPGTYSVYYVNQCGAEYFIDNAIITLIGETPPGGTATPSVPLSNQFCDSNPGTLKITTGPGAAPYEWYIDNVRYFEATTNELTYPFNHATYGIPGSHTVRVTYRVNGSPCYSSSYPVTVNNLPVTIIAPPTAANAGSDQTGAATCGLTSVTLSANNPAVGTGLWSIVSGTGGSFSNTSSRNSTFSGVAGNTYVLQWTIRNGSCAPSSDNVNVTFNRNPTTANAGPDQTGASTCGLTSVTLAANNPTVGTGAWSVVSGTGGSFSNASSRTSTFTGVAGNTYILRWTISNSPCNASSDDVTITFNRNPSSANAGPDQITCGLAQATLAAVAPTIGTGTWSIVSGTGGYFGNPPGTAISTSASAVFHGNAGSTYTLKWTTTSSPCAASSDNVNITFGQLPVQATAGPDKTDEEMCGLSSLTLNGNSPGSNSGQWTIVSGTGGYFGGVSGTTTATNPQVTFTGQPDVSYTLRWKISSSNCYTQDDIDIKFHSLPTTTATVSGNKRFGPGTLTLSATGANTGENYEWFNASNVSNYVGSPYLTASIDQSSNNYGYVKVVNASGCLSAPAWYSVDIYEKPVITATPSRIALNMSSTLSTGAIYDTYEWTREGSPNVLGTGVSISTNLTGTYRVRITKGGLPAESEPFELLAQMEGQNENYIITNSILAPGVTSLSEIDALLVDNLSQTIQYFDGLGRPKQTVSTQGSPSKKDIVQPIVYDAFGREARKYLPFTGDSDGWYKNNADIIDAATGDYAGLAASFYNNDNEKIADDQDKPFAQTIFENSPLNRVIEQGAPGEMWQPDGMNSYTSTDHTVKFAYESNTSPEVLMWNYTNPTETFPLGLVNAGSPGNLIYYPENVLHKKKTKDEHYNEVIEYTDKEGRIVLKRVQAVSGDVTVNDVNFASTYYIYDDFGRLATVIPPEATRLITKTPSYYFGNVDSDKNAFLSRWAFRYAYDARGRMIMKQIPGAEPVFMVYDNRDRLVMTQDGVQRLNNQWSYTKYDALNRPILTGIYTHPETVDQAAMSDLISTTLFYETYNGSDPYYGYTNNVFPTENRVVLTITFYDNYDFLNLWPDDYQYTNDGLSANENGIDYVQAGASDRTVGLVTGTIVRVLSEENITIKAFMKSVTFYDEKYRPIQIISDNVKGGLDRVSNLYDFTGKLLKAKTTHSVLNFKSHVNARSVINGLEKMQPSSAWSAGASSVEMLPANTDGWVEFRVPQTSKAMMVGFSTSDPDVTWQSIDHALYLKTNAGIEIRQSGSNAIVPSITTYTPGTVFRIERRGSNIFYYKDGLEIHQSPITTAALLVDVSLNSSGSKVFDMKSSFGKYSAKTITKTFTYDHAGRLTHSWHQIDDHDNVLVSFNKYNELGQLIDKKVHSTNGEATDAVQSVDYRYNIRGWLTSMNNASLSLDNQTNDDTGDYFGLELGYDQSFGLGSASFNGNISAMKWSNNFGLSTVKEKAYAYDYDAMNRITSAAYKIKEAAWSQASSNGFSESGYTYDLNGNIKSLTRYDGRGSDAPMDVLEYGYGAGSLVSNQLLKVIDTGDDFKGFRDGTNAGDDYSYDKNGNMLTDLNKGITVPIVYNHLNLPQEITKGGHTINYVYDATGRKLAQVTSFLNTLKESDYAGDFHYDNGLLSFVNHEEGRVVLSEEASLYINDGASVDDVVTFAATVSAVALNDDQSYLEVTSNGSGNAGLIPVGGQFPASPGDHFRIRARGYRTGSSAVYLFARTNLGSFKWAGDSWSGASLPSSHALETWVEETIIIPAGATYLEVGARWVNSAAGDKFYINDFEVTKLFSKEEPEYQYHMKDHLGNVRLTFTTKQETESSTATLEPDHANEDQSKFLRIANARKIQSALFDHTNGAATGYAERLNGSANEKYGIARSMNVMPGDVINAEVYAKYVDSNNGNWTQALTSLMAAIASNSGGIVVDGANYSSSTSSFSWPGLVSTSGSTGNGPKAYLNWIILDRDYNFKDAGFVRMSDVAREHGQDVAHEKLSANFTITEPGYVYIYLSNENETPVEVFFDDFKVEHIKSPVVQVDDYYPFGLTFNSYQRENSLENKHLYNGKELQDELSLGWYDYQARQYDPALGRFLSVDPLADVSRRWSPHTYGYNNPIRFVDPDGMLAEDRVKEEDPYILFNGQNRTMEIWDDNDTPDNYEDDTFVGSHDAKNEVVSTSKGKWEDGEYEMLDKEEPKMHGDNATNGVLDDSDNGSYGSGGIFRAESFEETTTDKTREGMGIHAGRENKDWDTERKTMGCIRVKPEGFDAIVDAIETYGPLQKVIVTNNRNSDNSNRVNYIAPGGPERFITSDDSIDYIMSVTGN